MYSLVVLVMHDLSRFPELLSAWSNAGAAGVTIVDSVGVGESQGPAWCDDLPVFPGLKDLLRSGETPRKTLFSVVLDDVVESLIDTTTEVMGDLSEPRKGILFVVPLGHVLGLRGGEQKEGQPAGS